MAEIKNGILSEVHGKISTVVGYKWRGRNLLRSIPTLSKKPATDKQKLQRYKMGLVSTFVSKIKAFVNEHYPSKEVNNKIVTGKEQLISLLLKEGIIIIDEIPYIDLEVVLLSVGILPPATITKIDYIKAEQFKIVWEDTTINVLAKKTDRLTLVMYNEILNTFNILESIAERRDKYTCFDLPNKWTEGNTHIWTVWKSEDNKYVSTSAYHGLMPLNEETKPR